MDMIPGKHNNIDFKYPNCHCFVMSDNVSAEIMTVQREPCI